MTAATSRGEGIHALPREPAGPRWWVTRVTGLGLGLALAADGVGVVLLAAADARSRAGAPGGYLLFWAGLAGIFLPSAGVLLLAQLSRGARLTAALGFGLALYLAKVVYEPSAFTFHDEFAHYRNAVNLLSSGQLFGYNPLIRATGYYPGLAVATDALVKLTGLPIYPSGLVLIGCGRLALVGALFLLAEELLGSPRAAGIAVLVYAASPNFLYWDSQYAYESLALPLAILAVYFIAARPVPSGAPPAAVARVFALVAVLAVVPTHHITSWILTALLLMWVAAGWLRRRCSRAAPEYLPFLPAAVTTVTAAAWFAGTAPVIVAYLGPVLSRAADQGFQLIIEHHISRDLFANTGQAVTAPRWEQAAAIATTLAILGTLPLALNRMRRTDLPFITKLLAASSLAWVAVIPLRLTADGQETANRASEFVYVGIALCFAFLLDSLLNSSRVRRVCAIGLVALVFTGGVAVSWNYAQRLAPDYRLTNGSAVVTPDDEALARWMLAALGPGHRVAADPQTSLALGSVGRQDVLSYAETGAQIWQIFYPRTVDRAVLAEIGRSRVQYVVVQLNVLDSPAGVPRFDQSEPESDYEAPLPAASLSKFSSSPVFRLIYRSGSLRVYQVAGGGQP